MYPPGQSAWLAIAIVLFPGSASAPVVAQSLLSVLSAVIAYKVFARYLSRAAGLWAGSVVALCPSLVISSGGLGHETTVIFLQLALFALVSKAAEHPGWRWAFLCGVVAGAATLIRPTMIIFPVLLTAGLLVAGYSMRRTIRIAVIAALSMLVIVGPWTARNYVRYGAFCPVSANLGWVMLSSNHPSSDGIFMETAAIGGGMNPVAHDRHQMKLALQAIRDNPVLFLQRVFKRVVFLWGAETSIVDGVLGVSSKLERHVSRALTQVVWAWLVAAWCIASIRTARSPVLQKPAALLFIQWSLLVAVLHAVMEPAARHHMALVPLIAALALPAYGSWVASRTTAQA